MKRTNTVMIIHSWLLFPLLLLGGCSSDRGEPQPEKINTDYSQLQLSSAQTQPYSKNTQTSVFSRHLKNGIRLRLTGNNVTTPNLLEVTADTNQPGSGFSSTNVQVAGVDEADRVKYNGEYLYITQTPTSYFTIAADSPLANSDDKASIRILRTLPDQTAATEVSKFELSDNNAFLSELYLINNQQQPATEIAGVSHSVLYGWNDMLVDNAVHWRSGKITVSVIDVTVAQDPQLSWELELEGNLEGSRKIDNVLYLITRYIPNIETLNPEAITLQEKEDNERKILNTAVADLLPRYRVNNGALTSLLNPENCLMPEVVDHNHGYADIVTITAVDLLNKQLLSSVCLNTPVDGIYSSPTHLYLGNTVTPASASISNLYQTAVHKFALNNGQINYRASAAVPGRLSWQNPSFRMGEHNGDLRIVTTESSLNNNFKHQLTILREQNGSNQLLKVSQLPNENNPEPIGKPGEDIYAVRFYDSRAYIVTFRQIDPLYVLDLSNSEQPSIAGELEVPGFSSYLHPLNDQYLLSIGREVENNRQKGIKVELFDIGNTSAPSSVNYLIIGDAGTWTQALTDQRSLSFLQLNDDELRFTFPAIVQNDYNWRYSGLEMFELSNLTTDTAQLRSVGHIVADQSTDTKTTPTIGWWGSEGRSVIHNDSLYFIYGNEVWGSFWQHPDMATGPF